MSTEVEISTITIKFQTKGYFRTEDIAALAENATEFLAEEDQDMVTGSVTVEISNADAGIVMSDEAKRELFLEMLESSQLAIAISLAPKGVEGIQLMDNEFDVELGD